MISLICKICNNRFTVKNYRRTTALYCSVQCYRKDPDWKKKISNIHKGKRYHNIIFKKGHSVPQEWRNNISKARKGSIPWNKGMAMSEEIRKKVSQGRKGKMIGNTNGFTKGFKPWNKGIGTKCSETEIIRASLKYRAWRKAVFERDNYTCQICGQVGGKLHADHIKRFSKFPKLRFIVSNGRTLCISCHRKTPTFGNNLRYAS